MWKLAVTRRELVDLIGLRRGNNVAGVIEGNDSSIELPRRDVMLAIWPSPPTDLGLPTAIIVPRGSQRDVLAWLTTYVRDLRPFTAYCRVVEEPVAIEFARNSPVPALGRAEGICAGLIIGEALAQSSGRTSIADLPMRTYSATLSNAFGRARALTGDHAGYLDIAQSWTVARQITNQDRPNLSPEAVSFVWAVAFGKMLPKGRGDSMFSEIEVLNAAWSHFSSSGDIPNSIWHHFVDGFPELEQMNAVLEIPREQRLHLIDAALQLLGASSRGAEERRAFLAGYLTSLLSPGSLDHAGILAPIASRLPSSYLWYGLCASVNHRGSALPAGNTIAQRIVRDLTLPDRLIDRPRCDIALEELMIAGAADQSLQMGGKSIGLDVDLLPGVTTAVRWSVHNASREDANRQVKIGAAQHLLGEMEGVTARIRYLQDRLREALDIGDGVPQRDRKRKK
jgi:hypothetical protein